MKSITITALHIAKDSPFPRSLKWTILSFIALVLTGLASIFLIHHFLGASFRDLTRDPAAVAHLPAYTGILSNLGIVLWACSASVCLFAALLLHSQPSRHRQRNFLFASALFSGWLMADDLLMLHEQVFPLLLHIPEMAVLVAYVGLASAYFLLFSRDILATAFPLFGLALSFLGFSLVADALPLAFSHPYLMEDGAKFIGIAAWFAYFCHTAWESTASHLR